ncbi:MAG: hypothetical protein WCX65_03525 [bacterium]
MDTISLNLNELLGNLLTGDNTIGKSLKRLSSGLQVNSAQDDPSGIGVANIARSRVESLDAAYDNIQQTISLLQVKDESFQSVVDIVLRIREIASKVKNDASMSAAQKADARVRINGFLADIVEIQKKTAFNSVKSLDQEEILFMSLRTGNWDIFNMDENGQYLAQITTAATADNYPSWSPDGSKIAYTSSETGNMEIFIYDLLTQTSANITNNIATDGLDVISWSPDSSKIAFLSQRNGNNEIYTANADGTGVKRLTNNITNDYKPYWSPDGTKIAFISNRTGNNDIYVMNPDGSGLLNLSNNVADDTAPVWSPDSSKIAFQSTRSGGSDIYSVNVDGTGLFRVTSNAAIEWAPLLSYEGDKVFFSRIVAGKWQIFSVNSDGTNEALLSPNPLANDLYMSWSPEYDRIIFQTSRNGAYEIYSMLPDGSKQTRLTNNPALDYIQNTLRAQQSALQRVSTQFGPDNGDKLTFALRPVMPVNIGIEDLNVSNQNFAAISVTRCDSAIDKLVGYRSEVRTLINQFQRLSNITKIEKNASGEFISNITGADDALEQAVKVRKSITQYIAASAIAHANLINQKASEFLIDSEK